ncbi:acyl-CoA dehydratase activase [uncultured Thiodictyon sp.]|uniref:acyl-CoA dehydratase activase n=1 Tax=uncultured Thiodictyon sp. TaxID=1846217 RepID=UPI002600A4A3|nr:acyl-CoA dehydratase activase [uncultured Thiodictyon sp.]
MAASEKIQGIFAGVDVGSLASKSVIIRDGEIAGFGLIPSGLNSEESGLNALAAALESAGLERSDISHIVSTGYGRISASYASKTVTEITCHAKGANYLFPNARTIIDIGGQDCKAIRVNGDGSVADFAMNDKCAAGTGRFLEVMAGLFKVSLSELGDLSLKADAVVPMSSTCTVFVESETISLLARGEKPHNIQAGIHHAIANRIAGLFSRVGIQSDVYFSGGVAKNKGMRKALEEVLKVNIVEPYFDPQLTGALGAAVLAQAIAVKEAKKGRQQESSAIQSAA